MPLGACPWSASTLSSLPSAVSEQNQTDGKTQRTEKKAAMAARTTILSEEI
ncbi:hypothetical protein KSZ_51900 [Dictyobacter formicarum]|uniref:Uncharacterized protein n=1 Tax=Dictyobacter formicarum TaxID=2778368 RepID=A0ABQ3VNA0_9CHLR|nr:hypothetical protein KSZ_51900 [Dictyobacter formicarum]